ncbi:hypothetical protein [Burkholderia cenocepacia]|uniref:hypothetical protein n=1 Tax=Burkholderia cenocepacia TaxID=95486 RepID=UPI002ABE383C|nr:hypothetical protein [Burkholderia cenocepacia]
MEIRTLSQRRGVAVALLTVLAAGAALSLFVSRGGLHALGTRVSDAYLSAAADAGVRVKTPVLVFMPGTELVAGDRHVQAFGFDECPKNDAIMRTLFGPDPDYGNTCIRLDREHVRVRTLDRAGTDKTEIWTVVRDGDRVGLVDGAGESIRRPQ